MHTKTDALHHIETALGETALEHDIDGIADAIHDENGGTWDLSGFDTDRFWEIAQAHALTLTVNWTAFDDDFNASWTVTTEENGELAGGSFKATEDEEETERNLSEAVTAHAYRLGSRIADRGDRATYGVTRAEA